jgi:hypothetical protein
MLKQTANAGVWGLADAQLQRVMELRFAAAGNSGAL